jgi:hypothetical protein
MRWIGVSLIGLLACDDYEVLGDLGETGWFSDDEVTSCATQLVGALPASGTSDWFYTAPLRAQIVGPLEGLRATLIDDEGLPVALAIALDPAVPDQLTLTPESPLTPDSGYTLRLRDCETTTEVAFRTAPYGLPLEGGPDALFGRTYALGLTDPGLDWVAPAGLGALFGSFFDSPILLGVRALGGGSLDFLGAQGYVDAGETIQIPSVPTWNFPTVVFEQGPGFSLTADAVELVISGYRVPVSGFTLSGTFAPDGTSFGGGRLAGLGDTRYTGGTLGQASNPAAMCQLAAGVGLACRACPDGGEFCLDVDVRNLTAVEVPGLTLRPVADTAP